MFWQRMVRLLPGRPGLMLILGVVAVVVFGVGFANQALTRQTLLVEYDQTKAKVERLEEQNRLLQQDLDRAQQGQLVPQKAWEYFGRVPKGTGVVVVDRPAGVSTGAESAAATSSSARESAPEPAWRAFLKRLVQP